MTDETSKFDALVKRLREASCLSFDDWTTVGPYSDYRTAPEAADRIEALTAERDAMKNIAYAAGYYQAECGLPEHENASAALVELKQTKAEIDQLRVALKPFATSLRGNWPHQSDDLKIRCGTSEFQLRLNLTLGDFRKAITALKGQQP